MCAPDPLVAWMAPVPVFKVLHAAAEAGQPIGTQKYTRCAYKPLALRCLGVLYIFTDTLGLSAVYRRIPGVSVDWLIGTLFPTLRQGEPLKP